MTSANLILAVIVTAICTALTFGYEGVLDPLQIAVVFVIYFLWALILIAIIGAQSEEGA